MKLNPYTEKPHAKVQTKKIKRVRKVISKLPLAIQKLIKQGEETIDASIEFQKNNSSNQEPEFPHNLNVFDLGEDIPGDVMKCLAMLYAAAGFHHVSIGCCCFSDDDTHRVKYPNKISFRVWR